MSPYMYENSIALMSLENESGRFVGQKSECGATNGTSLEKL